MPVAELEKCTGALPCPPDLPPPLTAPTPSPAVAAAAASVISCNSSTTTKSGGSSNSSPIAASASTSLFASLFPSSSAPSVSISDRSVADTSVMDPPLLCLSSLFPLAPERRQSQPSPHMSATALLQKAAQMGVSSPGSSFLRSLGLATSSMNSAGGEVSVAPLHWSQQHAASGLGLGLSYDGGEGGSALPDLMLRSSSVLPAAPDFLSLGMGPAFMSSMGRGLDLGGGLESSLPEKAWDAAADRKSNNSTFQ